MQERKLYVLDEPIPKEPTTNAPKAQRDAYSKNQNDSVYVTCLKLATMEFELQKQMVDMGAFTMVGHLKEIFQEHTHIERFVTIKALLSYKIVASSSINPYVLKMKGYLDHLEKLGLISQELVIDIILQSLPNAYNGFSINYNMNNMEKSISELHGMLKTIEQNIKTSNVLTVQKGRI